MSEKPPASGRAPGRERVPPLLVVSYGGHDVSVPPGRLRAIIEALMRDGGEMQLDRIPQGCLEFSWGSGRLNWHTKHFGPPTLER